MRETHLEGYALDRYEIREFIGEGGFGEVYRAWATDLHIEVAVKVLKPSQAAIDGTVERFAVEARKTAHLQHSNIVTTYAYGECNGWHYIAMKLLEGETLAERITRQRGPLPPHETSRVIRGVSNALDHAHGRGLVHRDVKPQNIFLERDGGIILTDFGLVKELQRTNITVTQAIIGTAEYISPEQVRGVGISGRSDIYALGHVAYEALTGRVAFPSTSGNPFPTLMAHVERDLPSLHIPGVAAAEAQAIDAVLRTATAKEPEARFATAGAFATALEQAVAGRQPLPKLEEIPPDTTWRKVLAGVALLAVLAASGIVYARRNVVTPADATATAIAMTAVADEALSPVFATATAVAVEMADARDKATRDAEEADRSERDRAASAEAAAAETRTADQNAAAAAEDAAAAEASRRRASDAAAAKRVQEESTRAAAAATASRVSADAAIAAAGADIAFVEKSTNRSGSVTLPNGVSCTAVVWQRSSGDPRDCDLNRLARGPKPVSCERGEEEACFFDDNEIKMEFRFRFRKPDGSVETRSVDILRGGN